MQCCINLTVILTVCVPLIYSQAITILVTEDHKRECGRPLSLKSTITGIPCCDTFTRIWRKDNEQIMSDGTEVISAGKYFEIVDNQSNTTTLIIKDIEDGDFDTKYTFSYNVYTSDAFTLKDDSFNCFPCLKCAAACFWPNLLGIPGGAVLLFLCYLFCFKFCGTCCYTRKFCCLKFERHGDYNYKFYGKAYERDKVKISRMMIMTTFLVTGVVNVVYAVAVSFVIGLFCTTTDICFYQLEFATMSMGFGIFTFPLFFHWTLKFKNDTFTAPQYIVNMLLTAFILPIPFLVLYLNCGTDANLIGDLMEESAQDGGNNRSKESGSSCWPPCSVGPDPNSPDPENARSLLKKKADKKNEKKPVAVVRSQPPKNRHVKTDNTESTRYSAETEIFDEGVHKSAKPRPLPSIGQPSNSPSRPLPQMPPSSQLEKGGIQLEPLGDSTSEKKKKKRRKKKESKQSDEED